jgi:hypothetical protein
MPARLVSLISFLVTQNQNFLRHHICRCWEKFDLKVMNKGLRIMSSLVFWDTECCYSIYTSWEAVAQGCESSRPQFLGVNYGLHSSEHFLVVIHSEWSKVHLHSITMMQFWNLPWLFQTSTMGRVSLFLVALLRGFNEKYSLIVGSCWSNSYQSPGQCWPWWSGPTICSSQALLEHQLWLAELLFFAEQTWIWFLAIIFFFLAIILRVLTS